MGLGIGIACLLVFLGAYGLNSLYVTVFYHRGLAHGAVRLAPGVRRFVVRTGPWVTGICPKAWSCMHRLHHRFADAPGDPHSPQEVGLPGVLAAQLRSYKRALVGLLKREEPWVATVGDLDFPVHWVNSRHVWFLPYLVHLGIGGGLTWISGAPLLGACYFVGMMCHPIQGFLVNGFGHAVGYRNFDTPDQSRNNTIVAWLVVGEGYQNNHHQDPGSAKFSYRPGEVDVGHWLCVGLERLGLLTILGRRIRVCESADERAS